MEMESNRGAATGPSVRKPAPPPPPLKSALKNKK